MTLDIKELVKRLREAHARVSLWPENRGMDGFMDLLALRNEVPNAIDALEAMAGEVAGLKEAHAAELKLCDEELFRVNKQWSDMCKRAEAAEAERDRLAGEVEKWKQRYFTASAQAIREAEKAEAAEAERDRLKAALRVTQERQNSDTMLLRQCYVTLAFAFYRLHESARSRDGELCLDFQRVRALIEKRFREIGVKL